MPTAVRSIRREHLEAFMVAELERTSPSSAATRYRSLQQLFKWLDNEGEIDASSMAKMRPLKNPEKPVPVLSDDHVRLLLADCSGKDFRNRRDCAIIRLFLDTGMRLEGLSGLMEARTSINLTASLHSTAADLSEVASDLAHLSTDEGIEQQARVLDRIAEDATEGAAILRAQIARRKRALGTPPHSDTPRRHL